MILFTNWRLVSFAHDCVVFDDSWTVVHGEVSPWKIYLSARKHQYLVQSSPYTYQHWHQYTSAKRIINRVQLGIFKVWIDFHCQPKAGSWEVSKFFSIAHCCLTNMYRSTHCWLVHSFICFFPEQVDVDSLTHSQGQHSNLWAQQVKDRISWPIATMSLPLLHARAILMSEAEVFFESF